eukprot:15467995-Alexandrium_andersonii.AAC.1
MAGAGCQLWISLSQSLTDKPDGPAIKRTDVQPIIVEPRLLIATISGATLQLAVVVAHAPSASGSTTKQD